MILDTKKAVAEISRMIALRKSKSDPHPSDDLAYENQIINQLI